MRGILYRTSQSKGEPKDRQTDQWTDKGKGDQSGFMKDQDKFQSGEQKGFSNNEVEKIQFRELSNDMDLFSDKMPPVENIWDSLDPLGPEMQTTKSFAKNEQKSK